MGKCNLPRATQSISSRKMTALLYLKTVLSVIVFEEKIIGFSYFLSSFLGDIQMIETVIFVFWWSTPQKNVNF